MLNNKTSFAALSPAELKKHIETFLVDHWSISSISDFIRNEKSFEKKYIFRVRDKDQSLSSIIGRVYHKVLMAFFKQYRDTKQKMTYDQLCFIAHAELGRIGANQYRPQKGKQISELQNEALKRVNALVQNFLQEFDSYEAEIEEIIFVEESFKEFVTINGIEIPLPLKMTPDVVFVRKGTLTLAVFDHKAKKNYTPEKDIILRLSNQSIGYKLGLDVTIKKYTQWLEKYPRLAEGVKDFFYYENKYTENRDGSRQIRQIPIDMEASAPLYEQLIFEGVFRLIEAVQNPDYVYLMNPHDFFEDGGDMMEFWMKTHIDGLEGFPNLKRNTKRLLKKRRSAIRRSALTGIPKSVIRSYGKPKDFISFTLTDMENLSIEERIEHRLRQFNYPVKVEHKISGYSCDTYLVTTGAGQQISKIYNYHLDIANAIGVTSVRIPQSMVEYEGQVWVAIEVRRKERKFLFLDSSDIPAGNVLPIGKDNFGTTWSWDIDNPSTAHMMIAGTTGSGKSVAIKTIIAVAEKKGMKVAILDPKREFTEYGDKHEVFNELEDIELFMGLKVDEMDKIFKNSGASGNSMNKQLIIFDESADCFARAGKVEGMRTLEQNTLILAQKARSAGIHLLLAAQRFSVNVLKGDAKANFALRLCLAVKSRVDSRVMLDQEGAEKLAGKGDALFSSPDVAEPVRIQCFSLKE